MTRRERILAQWESPKTSTKMEKRGGLREGVIHAKRRSAAVSQTSRSNARTPSRVEFSECLRPREAAAARASPIAALPLSITDASESRLLSRDALPFLLRA